MLATVQQIDAGRIHGSDAIDDALGSEALRQKLVNLPQMKTLALTGIDMSASLLKIRPRAVGCFS